MSPTATISTPRRHPTHLCADPTPERHWVASEPPSIVPLYPPHPLRSPRRTAAVYEPHRCHPTPLCADPAPERCWEALRPSSIVPQYPLHPLRSSRHPAATYEPHRRHLCSATPLLSVPIPPQSGAGRL
ncbi:hypothetical protein M422DRAFT_258900 [Sphaerobolus stellatus SS14]|uniref:Uncharacterized protein n=1 Tax=Sphaerobolus stellatus (strain SS14) TaxID=990650 RepID=A0A0C9VL54_SPHS4|nr:hypothetical protein M422DRAFT_258900 [Sphaerobolus stellatus SS14]